MILLVRRGGHDGGSITLQVLKVGGLEPVRFEMKFPDRDEGRQRSKEKAFVMRREDVPCECGVKKISSPCMCV